MDKQSLQKMQQESDQEFRKQFDPSSDSYHQGSTEPVPLGGDRVPETMYSMYPEGYDPTKPASQIDYGQEYTQVEAERTVYQNLKKSLAKLCPVVEAFLRHEQIFKEKGDAGNEKHVKAHQDNLAKEKVNLIEVQQELQKFVPELEGGSEAARAMASELKVVLEESNKKYEDKQSLTNFNFKVKKISTQAFSLAQKSLQKLKDIKKQHSLQAKETSKQEEPAST